MRIWFAIGLLLTLGCSTDRLACANLSGRYVVQAEDGRVYFTISQSGCRDLTIARSVDRFRENGETLHVRLDSSTATRWRGDVIDSARIISPSWTGDTLRLLSAKRSTAHDVSASRQTWWRFDNGDLCWRIDEYGATWHFVAARYDSDEDAAAYRSESGDQVNGCSPLYRSSGDTTR